MLHQRRCPFILAALCLMLSACTPQVVTVTVMVPPETIVVTATPIFSPSPSLSPSPTPSPVSSSSKVLTVCLVDEPDTLYLYGGSGLSSTRHVMEGLYDGPVDHVDYTYRPVILEKVPSVADGDAVAFTRRVREGDQVVDASGEVVELAEGKLIRPAGCYVEECAIEFESVPVLMERIQLTFALREDVTWADGVPLTAMDSVFGFQMASDSSTPGDRYLVDRTVSYRAVDDWHVRWLGLPGFTDVDYPKALFPPLPRHQLEGRTAGQVMRSLEVRRQPLGWGPFVVGEWVIGDHITLSRNPHYFRAAEGLPYLDEVVFRFASDPAELVSRLLAGECDIGLDGADLDPLMPLLMKAEERNLLDVVTAPSNGWEHIDFGIVPVSEHRDNDFFGDVRARQAIAQCIDRQAIVDEVAFGRSVVPDSYLSAKHPLHAEGTARWEYDIATGRALLAEAGWLDQDGDGLLEASTVDGVLPGTLFEVTFLTPAASLASQQVARIIRANLVDCGIRLNLETVPSWEFFADGPEGALFGRRFDLAEAAWWIDGAPPCGLYLTDETPVADHWQGDNVTGYSNPEYDAACRAALGALPGTRKYETFHKRAQVIFAEELPAIPLFWRLRVAVTHPRVLNLALDATTRSELWNIEALDVE